MKTGLVLEVLILKKLPKLPKQDPGLGNNAKHLHN